MTAPRPLPAALEALLDALETDLLASPAEEVRDALRETGRSKEGACREIRSVLEAAVTADEECSPVRTLHDLGQPGLHWLSRH